MDFEEKHKLAAIVFTDLVGFTKILGKDEQEGLELLQKQRDLFFPIVQSYNGTVLKELGDELLIMFESSIQAVRASSQIQEVAKDNIIALRIGIHIGDVVIKDKDIIGSGVNIASLIVPLTPTGSICISEDVWHQIRDQEGLYAVSLGKQKLKNVIDLIEIFKLVPDEVVLKAEKISFLQNLWQRRVPQIFVLYLSACWVIIEIVSSLLVDRYLLSPHLIDFSILTLLSLIPSILLLAYFHGKPDHDKWTKIEKIGIPINVILSVFILFFVFNTKDLGTIAKTVTVENEEGEKLERVIPKSEFRKKIGLFFFENETADSTLNWLQYGFEKALNIDLSQDIFIQTSSIYDRSANFHYPIYKKIKRAGFTKAIGLPFTLKQKIAKESHMNHFLSGSFTKQNDTLSIKTKLYDTKRGKLIAENSFKGTDVFKLADEMSIQLKHDLKIPSRHIEEAKDLPIQEILSNSIPAYKMCITGFNAIIFDNDYKIAIDNLEQSVKDDPNFAFAYTKLWELFTLTNQSLKAEKSLQHIMHYIYKIPETIQFQIKYTNYVLNQEQEKAFAVLKMWVELYPDDTSARANLALNYWDRNQMDEAILEYKYILELDPEEFDYIKKIGSIYEQIGEFEKALKYYKQYADQLPKVYRSYTAIGDLYYNMGDYQQAQSYYEKALIFEPEKISLLLNLANIEKRLGNFNKAFLQYEDALLLSKTPDDSAAVYSSLQLFYEMRGQINKSIEYSILKFVEKEKFEYPLQVLLDKLFDLTYLIYKKDFAFKNIHEIEAQLTPPFDKLISLGYLNIYLELEEADNAEKAIEGVELCIKNLVLEWLRPEVIDAQARIHEIRDEYEKAILMYQKELELQPTNTNIHWNIGRCYRKLKDYKQAENYLNKTIERFPFNPDYNFELALLYHDMGKKEKALKHLNITLEIWKDADLEYIPAQEAKEKLKELEL